jgi:hypothetical protein
VDGRSGHDGNRRFFEASDIGPNLNENRYVLRNREKRWRQAPRYSALRHYVFKQHAPPQTWRPCNCLQRTTRGILARPGARGRAATGPGADRQIRPSKKHPPRRRSGSPTISPTASVDIFCRLLPGGHCTVGWVE